MTMTANKLTKKVEALSGQNVSSCYQCGKCTGGCPFNSMMELMPSQVMRLVQTGDESVLDANSMWLCVACHVCTARCPRGVDLAKVMEALRQMKLRTGNDNDKMKMLQAKKKKGFPQMALVWSMRRLMS